MVLIEERFTYHIKDCYFEKANDKNLMKNKESGGYRPTYFCLKDNRTSLLWMVPLSSKIDKYQNIYNNKVKRYGKCETIVLGKYDGKKSAFLLQNMFPITEKYIDHIHTRNKHPVPVSYSLHRRISTNLKRILALSRKGKKITLTDIIKLENLMLLELE